MRRYKPEGRYPEAESPNWTTSSQSPNPEPCKRPRHTSPPSLFTLCTRRATRILPLLAPALHTLPDSLSVPLIQAFLWRAPSVEELLEFCEGVWWVPQHLSFCGATEAFSRRFQDVVFLRNLVRLDLRGCVWVESLGFLVGLRCLECLSLGGCARVRAEELVRVREVPRLQCLDVENIPTITDDFALTISGLASLRALNVSGTFVSDRFVEVLTYGSRLHSWASQQEQNRVKSLRLASESGQHELQTLLSQYPVSTLTCFRFQGTQITDATIGYLQALPTLLILDVRQTTKVTGRSLSSLRAKHRLIALPNNARLAARTNAMLARVSNGECGCRSMASQEDEGTDEFTKLCQQAFSQLLLKPDSEWNKLEFRTGKARQELRLSCGVNSGAATQEAIEPKTRNPKPGTWNLEPDFEWYKLGEFQTGESEAGMEAEFWCQ